MIFLGDVALDAYDAVTDSNISGNGSNNWTKTFHSNKDTLVDVIEWFEHITDTRVTLTPTDDGVALISNVHRLSQPQFTAQNLDGNLPIIDNNALSELNPINALKVKGKAKNTLAELWGFELNAATDNYTEVTVTHDNLVERAGGYEYYGDTISSTKSESKGEVINEARHKLIDQIRQTTWGSITTELFPGIAPYNTVKAQPVCAGQVLGDPTPINYEVSRVHHKIRTGDSDEQTHTELTVGLHADRDAISVNAENKSV